MTAASLTARMRHSRFASTAMSACLLAVTVLAGYVAFHHKSTSGGGARADSIAAFQLVEAEYVVLSLPHLTAAPATGVVYAALNASSQLRGHVFYAPPNGALHRTNALYVASTGKQSLLLRDRTPSGDIWNLSIVANPPGLKGRLVLTATWSPGILQGQMTSRRLA